MIVAQIFEFFQDKSEISFETFSKGLLHEIMTYKIEKNKLKRFMDRFGYSYEKELLAFKELFSDNIKISDINRAI